MVQHHVSEARPSDASNTRSQSLLRRAKSLSSIIYRNGIAMETRAIQHTKDANQSTLEELQELERELKKESHILQATHRILTLQRENARYKRLNEVSQIGPPINAANPECKTASVLSIVDDNFNEESLPEILCQAQVTTPLDSSAYDAYEQSSLRARAPYTCTAKCRSEYVGFIEHYLFTLDLYPSVSLHGLDSRLSAMATPVRIARESRSNFFLGESDIPLAVPPGGMALNGSIACLNHTMVLAYRLDTQDPIGRLSMQIVMVELDADLQPLGAPSILETREDLSINATAEDPRLLHHKGRLFVIYNSTLDGKRYETARYIFASEVAIYGPPGARLFRIIRRKRLSVGAIQQHTEKNWTPFSMAAGLYFIYTTNPPHVFVLEDEQWERAVNTIELKEVSRSTNKVAERLGLMRGGSPAIYDPERGLFVSFFHTQMMLKPERIDYNSLYFAGFYSFSAKPPFDIQGILPFPIVPRGVYQSTRKFWVTYPTGFVRRGDTVIVIYGQNDERVSAITLSYDALMAELEPPDV